MSDPKRWLDETGDDDDDARRLVRLGKTLGPRPGAADRAWPEFLAISGGFPPDPSGGGGADGGGLPEPGGAGEALGQSSGGAALGSAGGTSSVAATTSTSLTGTALVKTLLLGAALGVGGVLASRIVGQAVDAPVASPPAPQSQVTTPAARTPGAADSPPEPANVSAAPPDRAPQRPTNVAPIAPQPLTEPLPAPAATGVSGFPREIGVTSFPIDADRTNLLQREARELADARALLAQGRPGEALTLLRASAERFRTGTLGQEREALTIEALAKSGEQNAARSLARGFLARFPNSPLVERVRRFAAE